MKRIKGLDSIRFICALFVLFGHLGFPLPGILTAPNTNSHLKLIGKIFPLFFNGPAAVIVFFIISGFCINYPFIEKKKINFLSYYSRRLLRIGIPALIAIPIYQILHLELKYPEYGVFWSIICEIIYYCIYPVLLYVKRYLKWEYMILLSTIVTFTILLICLNDVRAAHQNYIALGLFTFIIGLPCWLLGCWLSENYLRFKILSPPQIWILRLFMLFIVLILRLIKFHANTVFASNCFTLNMFAFIACAWIGFEIMYFQNRQPFQLLEWCGKWSYSLYIMHEPSAKLIYAIGLGTILTKYVYLLSIFCLLGSYIFYVLIEQPSHNFSAFISSYLTKKHPSLQTDTTKQII